METRLPDVSFDDISDKELPASILAPLDRPVPSASVYANRKDVEEWTGRGVIYKPGFLPDNLINAYCDERSRLNLPGGWPYETPYMKISSLRNLSLYPPMIRLIESIIGEPMGLHLNLTGWVSTERDFHQDGLLNPPYVGTYYIAAWLALDDIHPDSGPFQYVPGSHRWGYLRREKIFKYISEEEQKSRDWPTKTQDWVAGACMREIEKRNGEIVSYVPKRGDLLLWHSNLIHRGSKPKVPGLERRALICHYSALSVREDMPNRAQHAGGGWYFTF